MPKENKALSIKIMIAVLVEFAVVLIIMINYSIVQKNRVIARCEDTIKSKTVDAAYGIDASIGYALSSIQVTAVAIEGIMDGPEDREAIESIAGYINNTPFNSIEFINKDGINMTDAGVHFDASDREYYKEGIKGNTGIWINYHPKYADEPLLNFYTPLYKNEEIVGVITGTLGGNTNIMPMLMSNLYGHTIIGMVLDENNGLIASTTPFNTGTVIDWDTTNLPDTIKQQFLDAISAADGEVFKIKGLTGDILGNVSTIDITGWKVIEIIPASTTRVIEAETNRSAYFSIGIIFSVGIILVIVIFIDLIKTTKRREEALLYESETDKLTGLYNRRAYEEAITSLMEEVDLKDFVYASLDVNGLKVVNDNLGHAAGDELLIGAAKCMRQCFGKYGKIYRSGGDEFEVLFYANDLQLEEIKNDFDNLCLEWQGEFVKELSVSSGFAKACTNPGRDVRELAKLADARMYESKAAYYKAKGVDRRGQRAAHTALCALYTKILKINLTEDSYQIVDMDISEQTKEKGFSEKISEWLYEFGKSGQVHIEDVDDYFKKTDINFLKEYFNSDKTSISIFYRRLIKGEYKDAVMEMIPADDYTPENQSLFLYVKSIDKLNL